MVKSPPARSGIDTILDLECIAKLIEQHSWAEIEIESLPIP
jgi:hypothetical protein